MKEWKEEKEKARDKFLSKSYKHLLFVISSFQQIYKTVFIILQANN